jgi:TPR repeat protein
VFRIAALCAALALATAAAADAPMVQSPTLSTASPIPSDDAKCSTCDGVRLMNDGQFDRAMHIFQMRAAAGDAVAINNIGWMYQYGLGRPVDTDEAARWYVKAAAAGNDIGHANLIRLGDTFATGDGVPVDYARARRYYAKAAAAGMVDGVSHIGWMYQHGDGVPVDLAQALKFYRQAVQEPHPDPFAMVEIGYLYEHGLGVKQDFDTAWCWYLWAGLHGNARGPFHYATLAASGHPMPKDCVALNQLAPGAWQPASRQSPDAPLPESLH